MQQKIRSSMLVFLDIILVNISLTIAYLLRFNLSGISISNEFLNNVVQLAIIATILKVLCYFAFRLYSSLWRYAGIYEMTSILFAAFVSNVIIVLLILIFPTTSMRIAPVGIFIITFFTDIFLIGGIRFSYRIIRRIVKGEVIKIKDSKRILIVGGGDAGAIIIKEMKLHPELKSNPVAIIDDDVLKFGRKINGVPIIGQRKDIAEIIDKKKIDEVIIALPSVGNKIIREIYNECSKTECKIKILPAVTQLIDESVIIQKIRNVDIEDLLGRESIKLDMEEISSSLSGQVVMVTGGGGSIGSELCRQIATYKPKQLIILDNYENNAYDIQNELIGSFPELDLVTIIANIREKYRIERIFEKYSPDVVFHAAAHKHVPLMENNPQEAIRNNVLGTLNVTECADKYKAKRFVLISTDKAVNPTNIMGASKRIAEMIVQSINRVSSTDFVAVRFGNVLGSNGSVIPLFKKQIEQGGPVTVTHPEIIRYFMTIPEAVQLVIQAGSMAKGGEIFVLDMGEPVKIYDLAINLIRLSGFEPDEDIKIEFTGLRPGEKLYEELLLEEEGLQSTKNNKIFIAQPVDIDFNALKNEISTLEKITMNSPEDLISSVQELVPTYNNRKNNN